MVRLFIENIEIELDKNVEFSITKQFEDLTNPTVIINDWSKTVEIPFTQKNNQTFGSIYNVDMQTLEGDYTLMGLYFNPLKKLDFRLEYNDSVLMTGYAKMNTVTKKDDSGTYNITLNGSLGKVLQEMKKITFDSTYDEKEYVIDDKYVYDVINKELVYKTWIKDNQDEPLLEDAEIDDIIGFAPNNSFNSEFDYKSYQTDANASSTFKDTLDATPAFTALNITSESVIGDGLLPSNYGEYRSYLQTPYIFFNKLWQIYQKKVEELTGYHFELDSEWFSDTNKYFYNVIMLLKNMEADEMKYTNLYHLTLSGITYSYDDFISYTSFPNPSAPFFSYTPPVNTESISKVVINHPNETQKEEYIIYNSEWINVPHGGYVSINKIPLRFSIKNIDEGEGDRNRIFLRSGYNDNCIINNDIEILVKIIKEDNTVFKQFKKTLTGRQTTKDNEVCLNKEGLFEFGRIAPSSLVYDFDLNINSIFFNSEINKFKIKVSVIYNYTYDNGGSDATFYLPFALCKLERILTSDVWTIYAYNAFDFTVNIRSTPEVSFICKVPINRTDCLITLQSLWDSDFSLYNVIMNYCKKFHILIQVDDDNKKIKFIPAWKYFENYTVEDWTNKLDLSKDYIIKPCTFENKYVIFNYDENKTQLGEEYVNKYSVEFGSKKLVTQYNFNSESKDVFDTKVAAPIVNTDMNLSWNDLYSGNVRYVLPHNILPYQKDKDKKFKSNFGGMYFWNGCRKWDNNPNYNFRTALITDDTTLQLTNDTYFYLNNLTLPQFTKSTDTYPDINIVNGRDMITFTAPVENYTYLASQYDNKYGIFENFWENYINELYNKNNKVVTCYLKLSPIDYINFTFNKFVKIENQLYFVNKIYDFSVTDNVSTKVDLITVNDLSAYYTINYNNLYIYSDKNMVEVPYNGYKILNIISNVGFNSEWYGADDTDYWVVKPLNYVESGESMLFVGKLTTGTTLSTKLILTGNDEEGNPTVKKTINVKSATGNAPITATPFYNTASSASTTATITITSNQNWTVLKTFDNMYADDLDITLSATSGSAGTIQLTVTVNKGKNGAIRDYYIGNQTTGDAQVFRIVLTSDINE